MSENHQPEERDVREAEMREMQVKPPEKREMSRRQFLSYTLGGTGAFMVGVPLLYNLRFAVDPLLQDQAGGAFVKVAKADQITQTPKSFTFEKTVVDGWYESNQRFEAWIAKDAEGTIFALSPICKHLGCTVNWAAQQPDQYFCPCHEARYTKDGLNLVVAPSPLDQYEVKVDENGNVYLGQIIPNKRV